jgi:predicted Zn-dependent protease
VNVLSLPGGFEYVNTLFIAAADSEAEPVAVIAHQIAHTTARYGA